MMIRERQNQFLSKIPEMSYHLRLKPNQILRELSSMLKLHYIYVDSGVIPLDANEVDTAHFFPRRS